MMIVVYILAGIGTAVVLAVFAVWTACLISERGDRRYSDGFTKGRKEGRKDQYPYTSEPLKLEYTRTDEGWRVDCGVLPGSPPCGEGHSPDKAVENLVFRLLQEWSIWGPILKRVAHDHTLELARRAALRAEKETDNG